MASSFNLPNMCMFITSLPKWDLPLCQNVDNENKFFFFDYPGRIADL